MNQNQPPSSPSSTAPQEMQTPETPETQIAESNVVSPVPSISPQNADYESHGVTKRIGAQKLPKKIPFMPGDRLAPNLPQAEAPLPQRAPGPIRIQEDARIDLEDSDSDSDNEAFVQNNSSGAGPSSSGYGGSSRSARSQFKMIGTSIEIVAEPEKELVEAKPEKEFTCIQGAQLPVKYGQTNPFLGAAGFTVLVAGVLYWLYRKIFR